MRLVAISILILSHYFLPAQDEDKKLGLQLFTAIKNNDPQGVIRMIDTTDFDAPVMPLNESEFKEIIADYSNAIRKTGDYRSIKYNKWQRAGIIKMESGDDGAFEITYYGSSKTEEKIKFMKFDAPFSYREVFGLKRFNYPELFKETDRHYDGVFALKTGTFEALRLKVPDYLLSKFSFKQNKKEIERLIDYYHAKIRGYSELSESDVDKYFSYTIFNDDKTSDLDIIVNYKVKANKVLITKIQFMSYDKNFDSHALPGGIKKPKLNPKVKSETEVDLAPSDH